MKVITVSGTPGTGKTYLSKRLAKKLNFHYIDTNKLISKYRLSEGYDKKRKSKIIDVNKLNKKLIEITGFFKTYKVNGHAPMSGAERAKTSAQLKIQINNKIPKGIIIDSHLSHYLPRKYVSLCIITKCDIKELNKRLRKKKFSQSKIQENLQSEIFDVCLNEARQRKHKIIIIDTTKAFNINKLIRSTGG